MNVRAYVLVTLAYWAFTVTDGALRMLVLLYFHDLGYRPVSLALLFMLYELFGVATNLIGGWIGTRTGLKRTLVAGLTLQVVALLLLSLHQSSWREWLAVAWVMAAQALSGIAKDLTKMSSKTAVKFVAGDGKLFKLVALLTGSKNALKGIGFFVGAALLGSLGFATALVTMAIAIAVVLVIVLVALGNIGQVKDAPLKAVLDKSPAITRLSLARFFLFGSRDIWFVVALPVFLESELGWTFEAIGAFLAVWVIGYGAIQALTPKISSARRSASPVGSYRRLPTMATTIGFVIAAVWVDQLKALFTVAGLLVFGALFAITSSTHSYLILAYSQGEDDTAMDVGFYYSANAAGRLVGTLLSGGLFMVGGFIAALFGTIAFLLAALVVSIGLPPLPHETPLEEDRDVAVS